MGPRFDETVRGARFFDAQLPRLIKVIEDNTAELKRANDLKELEIKQTQELFGPHFELGVKQDEGKPEERKDLPHDSRGETSAAE